MIAPGVYYYDNLIVLKEARSPAVLVEAAVLTNYNDEAAASSPEFQQKVTEALREAVTTYAGMVAPLNPQQVFHAPQPEIRRAVVPGGKDSQAIVDDAKAAM